MNTSQNELADQLARLPRLIAESRRQAASSNRKYREAAARLSLAALSKPLFPGKDGLRPAANETERELAITYTAGTDPALIDLAEDRELDQIAADEAANAFAALCLIANLFIEGVSYAAEYPATHHPDR
jgi:hypothetical protein